MKTSFFYLVIMMVVIMMTSCKKESIPYIEPDKGTEYYPAIVGKYITYKYDSVIFDDNGITRHNLSGFIKEVISEEIEKNDVQKKYKIIKYWRQSDTVQWQLTDVESVTILEDRVIKTEENLPFIKMIFPNDEGVVWEGNSMFDNSVIVKVYGEELTPYEYWEYEVINKGNPITLNGITFNETIEVLQVDDNSSNRSKRYATETFAKNVGLIRKEMKIYETQNPKEGQPWETYAQKGYSLIQEVIDHN